MKKLTISDLMTSNNVKFLPGVEETVLVGFSRKHVISIEWGKYLHDSNSLRLRVKSDLEGFKFEEVKVKVDTSMVELKGQLSKDAFSAVLHACENSFLGIKMPDSFNIKDDLPKYYTCNREQYSIMSSIFDRLNVVMGRKGNLLSESFKLSPLESGELLKIRNYMEVGEIKAQHCIELTIRETKLNAPKFSYSNEFVKSTFTGEQFSLSKVLSPYLTGSRVHDNIESLRWNPIDDWTIEVPLRHRSTLEVLYLYLKVVS